ncbi:MAG: ABC transporter substrate-binding protein [Acidimicrobiia bacterium]
MRAQDRRPSHRLIGAIWVTLALLVAACGGDGATDTTPVSGTAGPETTTSDALVPIDVMFPVNSPILFGYRVAQEAGYYADEGLEVSMEFLDGGGAVVSQLVAGNGDIANIPVGPVVEAIEEGHTELRAVWNQVYGSIFYMAAPKGSGITTPEDLAGKKVGVSDLSGGEVPIVRGIIETAGLSEQDVELIPIGEGTALAVNAIETGQVDVFGGSINDIIALEVQGLEFDYILPDALLELPASGIVVRQEMVDEHPEVIEGFLRAIAKGFYWAQVNPEATLALIMNVTPEQFTDETGERIFRATIPLNWAPEGTQMGFQSPETWAAYFDFIGAEQPEVDLSTIVTDQFLDAGNDFDQAAVEEDANSYAP